MEESKFLENFAAIFDDVDVNGLSMDTHFKDFDEWSSLAALGLLAVVSDEYNVELNNDDIKNAVTIQDIFNVVKNRI
jgi:acyl carrier protein